MSARVADTEKLSAAKHGYVVIPSFDDRAGAAWLSHAAEPPAARPLVAVLSGGDIDPALLASILAEG